MPVSKTADNHSHGASRMTFPWEQPPEPIKDVAVRPELQRDPLTGLLPGQRDPLDLPDFLNRVKGPQVTAPSSALPWASTY